ncbi:dehydration-responsive element-binding protein 2A [Pyrus ussuriensis x Pyrus communis]|uniref:Dehydration-responsive element-binding protein 2A n=1 Tax=Pyrus ussuriensis x Pyrus communis TaxID=2448454 RepID=A0A5N5G9D1_9ROSA|nr:dehydration-responsive element-binding protein 2A [Pyrus ussuriensis x Pyrus communis]
MNNSKVEGLSWALKPRSPTKSGQWDVSVHAQADLSQAATRQTKPQQEEPSCNKTSRNELTHTKTLKPSRALMRRTSQAPRPSRTSRVEHSEAVEEGDTTMETELIRGDPAHLLHRSKPHTMKRAPIEENLERARSGSGYRA